ncbi:MAG: RsmE family RNA methyltransferase [Candidatus Marinimicrobia bacterium]|nr:RsmE family RNA methyltransferase [Candidatus Neomarinimicrobiota bacterium]
MSHKEYFFSDNISSEKSQLIIEGQEHFHLYKVLRGKVGDNIFATDGKFSMYSCEILEINQKETVCKITDTIKNHYELDINISIAVGMIKQKRWEWLIEKTTELGVTNIYPLDTKYSENKYMKPKRDTKIILSAVKQCGRSVIPKIFPLTKFEEFINKNQNAKKIILIQNNEYSQLEQFSNGKNKEIILLIGSEGGFSEEEIKLAIENGFSPKFLTNRRLRTETACVCGLSKIV